MAQKYLISNYVHILSSILLAVFGVKILKEAYYMDPDEAREEYDEADEEIKKKVTSKKNVMYDTF